MSVMRFIGARTFLPTTDPACLVEFEAEGPVPGPSDLIVRIHACAVNPVDTKIRKSLGATMHEPPRILGWDAAGVVTEVGSEVSDFKIGDEVFYSGDLMHQGCNAELQAVDARLVALKPRNWSFEESAALPLAGITAWELLFERMGVSADGKDRDKAILIINGAGGVGSALIPLARDAGLIVIATASRPETIAWCQQLGAHHVINHRKDLIAQSEALGFASYPFIANLHQPEIHWSATTQLIAPFGTLGLIVEPSEKLHIGDPLKAKCARIAWEFMGARAKFQSPDMHQQGRILASLAARCEAGKFPKIHTRVFDSLSVENLRAAHTAMEQGQAHGKWVLKCASC
ncbi:MAG: zinc-binding alcohol dehydrogenase family protein [Luteolibacter sp.]